MRWRLLADVGMALVETTATSQELALDMLPFLLDRFTRPHQLLDQLDAEVESVLAGDTLAAQRLCERLDVLARSFPELIGSEAGHRPSSNTLIKVTTRTRWTSISMRARSRSTPSFASARRLPWPRSTRYPATLDSALDVVLGLAMLTSAADHLVKGLVNGGPPSVAEALGMLGLYGHWAALSPLLCR